MTQNTAQQIRKEMAKRINDLCDLVIEQEKRIEATESHLQTLAKGSGDHGLWIGNLRTLANTHETHMQANTDNIEHAEQRDCRGRSDLRIELKRYVNRAILVLVAFVLGLFTIAILL